MKNVFEYFIILLKWKKFLFITLFLTLIGSYLMVYFIIDEEYKASSLIIPVEEESIGGMSSMLKSLKGLPIGMGGSLNNQIDLYNTIISSRSVLEKAVKRFDLVNVYKLNKEEVGYKEKALLILKKSIHANETPESAYEIEVTSNNPQLSADIANYLVQLLNEKIVELNIKKSTENRKFLENRVIEIRYTLSVFEDSLRQYQQVSGLYNAESQIKDILSVYVQLETELSSKEMEKSILSKLYEENSPQLKNINIQIDEYKKHLSELRQKGNPNGILLSLKGLPTKALDYLRIRREVEINSQILEFILPLYEQAKFDEQKEIPILQVIDSAVPPARKSYPPRVIFALMITFGMFIFLYSIILIKENERLQNSDNIKLIKKNLFKW